MRIVYLGTPDFAVLPLQKLIDEGYDIVAVCTNKDKPVGRKQILTACPVKECAIKNNLEVLQYDKIRVEGVEDLKKLNADLFITCAFGQILSKEILDIPKYGTFNIHGSLLPKYRGSSPIQWAVLNGEKETGITIMRTDIGIDTGDIIYQEKIAVDENETSGELFDRLSVLGADCIIKALKLLENGKITYQKQDEKEATLTKMLKKEEAKINFENNTDSIHNFVRGMNPWPVAFTEYNGEIIKVFKTKKGSSKGKAGEILTANPKDGLEIATLDGSIFIIELQKAGGKRMLATDFLRGNKINEGDFFSK
ncbi:MAG: methionyl-tRNA formyltransferase [Clostridiales bacterium]|nr:methionyl-tRNA formyltransferase [Clostridiales bacterium]